MSTIETADRAAGLQPQRPYSVASCQVPPTVPAARKPSFGRGGIEATVTLLLTLLIIRTWFLQAFYVDGGSMAPTLLARHLAVDCPTCSYRFAAGIENQATDGRPANCPLCGSGEAILEIANQRAPDTVLVDKTTFLFRAPRRWEVVSLRAPHEAGKLCVKRVVGLPGEHISIRDGDVYVAGQIVRKTLDQQRATAIPIYDDRYRRPENSGPASWQSTAQSGWRTEPEGYSWHPPAESTQEVAPGSFPAAALVYHHWRRDGANHDWRESPIDDSYGYNQTLPIRELHNVRDLLLSFRMRSSDRGQLFLRASDGVQELVATLSDSGEASLACDGQPVAGGALRSPLGRAAHLVEFSLIDRACMLAIDGEVVIDYPLAARRTDGDGMSTPLAIAAAGGPLDISELCICRDLYYVDVPAELSATPAGGEYVLADDEFFVLSENSPLGADSRYQSFGPAVPFKLFVGKPFIAVTASSGGWYTGGAIQVPALRQIRYIR